MPGRKWTACVAVLALTVAVDQAAKWLVLRFLPIGGESISLLGGLLGLAPLRQEGAALGLLGSLAPELLSRALPALAAFAGGALGNLLDRLRLDAVIEFVQLDLRVLRLPDFNLADCAIAAGMALVLLDLVAAEAGAGKSPGPDPRAGPAAG
jgi:signal peptidase II